MKDIRKLVESRLLGESFLYPQFTVLKDMSISWDSHGDIEPVLGLDNGWFDLPEGTNCTAFARDGELTFYRDFDGGDRGLTEEEIEYLERYGYITFRGSKRSKSKG